jgi:hypothetical protein
VQKIISLCPIFLQPKRDCRGDNFVTAQRRYGTARKGGYYFLDKKQLCEIKSVHQINSQKIRRRRIRREKGAYDTIIPATDWLPRRPWPARPLLYVHAATWARPAGFKLPSNGRGQGPTYFVRAAASFRSLLSRRRWFAGLGWAGSLSRFFKWENGPSQ